MVIDSMQSVDTATDQAFKGEQLFEASQKLSLANAELAEMQVRTHKNAAAQGEHNDKLTEAQVKTQQIVAEQEEYNGKVRAGGGGFDGIIGKLAGMAGAYMGIGKVFNLSDQMSQTTARLDLMNDGLQTTEELQNKVFASAQASRAVYTQTADMVSKLGQRAGDAFSSNDETIKFAENLNKSFVIAGTSQQEVSSASMQLTQALGSGVLRGEELNAVFEAAPNIIQTIADYMNIPIGKVREMASEGGISAKVVKNAMLGATDEINRQFDRMPMTWAQVWNGVCNEVIFAMQPVLEFISMLAQNWEILEPIVMGAAVAVGLYAAAMLISNTVTGAGAMITSIHAAKLSLHSGATFAATVAQYGFNAALLACPITWIVGGLILLIAAFYAVIAGMNRGKEETISATGLIMGALFFAGAALGNVFVGAYNIVIDVFTIIQNALIDVANFIGNVFFDLTCSIGRLFFDMVDWVLSLLQSLAGAVDMIFKTNLSSSIQGWRDSVSEFSDDVYGTGKVFFERVNGDDYKLKGYDYGEAWQNGNAFGEGIDAEVGNLLDKLLPKVDETAANTGAIADSLEITEDELKYLRDIAEQETINRFTTAEIKLDMTNNNKISSDTDVDGMISYMVTGVRDAMQMVAEGVHE